MWITFEMQSPSYGMGYGYEGLGRTPSLITCVGPDILIDGLPGNDAR